MKNSLQSAESEPDVLLATPDRLTAELRAGAHEAILPAETISRVLSTSEKTAISGGLSEEEARQRILDMNTPEYIVENFLTEGAKEENGSYVHEVVSLPDGGQISYTEPTSPYAEIDVLGTAVPADFAHAEFPRKDGELRPFTRGDLPSETDFAFTAAQAELLQIMYADSRGQNKKAAIMQNCTSRLSPVTSQSIGVPHFHATLHNLDYFEPHIITDQPDMQSEEAITHDAELAAELLPRLERTVASALEARGLNADGLLVVQRHSPPYGFSIVFDGEEALTIDNLTESPDNLARLQAVKEAVYTFHERLIGHMTTDPTAADELRDRYGIEWQKPLTDQPSYHEIIDVTNDGLVRATYSTVLISRAGPVEKCHAKLERGADPSFAGAEAVTGAYERYAKSAGRATLAAASVTL